MPNKTRGPDTPSPRFVRLIGSFLCYGILTNAYTNHVGVGLTLGVVRVMERLSAMWQRGTF